MIPRRLYHVIDVTGGGTVRVQAAEGKLVDRATGVVIHAGDPVYKDEGRWHYWKRLHPARVTGIYRGLWWGRDRRGAPARGHQGPLAALWGSP